MKVKTFFINMAEKQYKDNSGAFFNNKNKSPNDKRPDYTGSLTLNGDKMFISVWKKTSQKGNDYLSLSASKPNADYNQRDSDPDNNRGALFYNEEGKDCNISGKVKLNGDFYLLKVHQKENSNGIFFVFDIENFTPNKPQDIEDQSQDRNQDESYNQSIPFDEDNYSQDQEQNEENNKQTGDSTSFNIFTMGNT